MRKKKTFKPTVKQLIEVGYACQCAMEAAKKVKWLYKPAELEWSFEEGIAWALLHSREQNVPDHIIREVFRVSWLYFLKPEQRETWQEHTRQN